MSADRREHDSAYSEKREHTHRFIDAVHAAARMQAEFSVDSRMLTPATRTIELFDLSWKCDRSAYAQTLRYRQPDASATSTTCEWIVCIAHERPILSPVIRNMYHEETKSSLVVTVAIVCPFGVHDQNLMTTLRLCN